LEYGFSSATLAAVVGPVFDKIAATLVDAFVKRADQIYGAEA
jgi:ribosome-associated toxin RatA of RatAB toxin-antitoxin module